MHRLVVILLLFALTLQSVWGAAEVYCQHEQGRAAQHVGHHVHERATVDNEQMQADARHEPLGKAKAKSTAAIDHDHHCCSPLVVLPQAPPAMAGLPAFSEQVATSVPVYRSADPSPIERPNWPASL